MILGKSNHPVEIKRVNVKVWTLRDEIEQALINLKKECKHDDEFKQRFEEVRSTYKKGPREYSDQSSTSTEQESPAEEMDDDMAAMAAALDNEDNDQDEVDAHMAEVAGEEAAENIAVESKGDANEDSKLPKQFKRAIPVDSKCAGGFSFLSDVNMDNILFFSTHNFTIGQSIVLEFLIPLKFTLSAQVKYSHRYSSASRVISDTKPDYRVIAEFTFIHDGERTNLREFLKSIEPDIPDPPKRVSSSSADADDDDDDDLSDFGF